MDARQFAAACLARLAELFPAAKVVIGIGGTCRDPREVARSYAQAQRTTHSMVVRVFGEWSGAATPVEPVHAAREQVRT